MTFLALALVSPRLRPMATTKASPVSNISGVAGSGTALIWTLSNQTFEEDTALMFVNSASAMKDKEIAAILFWELIPA